MKSPQSSRKIGFLVSLLAATTWALALSAQAGYAPFPYATDFESGLLNTNYWTLQGTWGLSTEAAKSGTNALTDSPQGVYAANDDSAAILGVNLRRAVRPVLSFWQSHALEPNRDYGLVELSSDQGVSWTRWDEVTGWTGTNWEQVQIDLTGYAGTQTLIRFRLKTDGQNQADGWYIDDVQVAENTAGTAPYPFSDNMDSPASQNNWLGSGWKQVLGSAQNNSGQSWRCLIGGGYQPGDLDSYNGLTLAKTVDLTTSVDPQLTFWWRAGSQQENNFYVQVSRDGGFTWDTVWQWRSGNEWCCWGNSWWQSANWTREAISLDAYSDSPELVVRFLVRNPLRVEDGGTCGLLIDFQVDDVQIAETPPPATAPADVPAATSPGTDPTHAALLTWSGSTATNFAYYAIYRSVSPGVSASSTLVAALSNQNTLSYQDTGLDVCGRTYYYTLLVWGSNGLHSPGLGDMTYRTHWGPVITTLPFADGLETGTASWALDRPWGLTSQQAHQGVFSLTDSPDGEYLNGADAAATLQVYLTGLQRPMLSFWQLYSLQLNQDFGFVEISSDDGANWSRAMTVTGYGGTNWQNPQLDLTPWSGQLILIRFRLKADSYWQDDGWYLDEVAIQDNGAVAASYPFFDNMDEAGSQHNWVTGNWAQVPGGNHGTDGQSWRCVLGGGYQPGERDAYTSLTLAKTVDLRATLKPQLSFWWRAGSQQENNFYAQVSADGGKNWDNVWQWRSGNEWCCWGNSWWQSSDWSVAAASLEAYKSSGQVAVRFVARNPLRVEDGSAANFFLDFQVDDVQIAETPGPAMAPADVPAFISPGKDPTHDALLSWDSSTATNFACYAIYRSVSPGVGAGSYLVTAISNQNTLSYQDTSLDVCGRTYYYTLLVWGSNGLHSPGLGDMTYRTHWGPVITALPFTDGLDSGTASWALDRPWGLTSQQAHQGVSSLTDSPDGEYLDSVDAAATLQVYLTGLQRPLLSIWQLYSLQLNQDFGFVEISSDDGANWTRWMTVTGYGGTNWQNPQLDLTPWSGQLILIRFRLKTDSYWQDDGWYLDDVAIQDNGAMAVSYPFLDNMDDLGSRTNWLAANWAQVPGGSHGADGQSWRSVLGGGYQPGDRETYTSLTLAQTVDLRATVKPQVSFWWRAGAQQENNFYVQVSADAGKNWDTVWQWRSGNEWCCWGNSWWQSSDWSLAAASLEAYKSSAQVAVRFLARNPLRVEDGSGASLLVDFQVDDVQISETPPPATAPADVPAAISPGTDPTHTALLTWSGSTATNFACYAIYRSVSPGVGSSSYLVAALRNQNTLSYQDTGLDVCGRTYYYTLLVWGSNGLHSPGLGDMTYRTQWGPVITRFPWADGFESGTASWALDRPWGLTAQQTHRGGVCLTDSPGGDYLNSVDASATVQLYLAGLQRPRLSFWQLYSLQLNQDFGFIEVSSDDGVNWTRWMTVTGYGGTNWENPQLDLTPWAGQLILLRFRLQTDSSWQDDGWYIDDLSVQDSGVMVAAYPFFDDMDVDASQTRWLAANWAQVPGGAHGVAGQSWRCLVGGGYQPGDRDEYASLTMAEVVDLSSTTKPQLSFWWRAGAQQENNFYAQVSRDAGKNWETLWQWRSGSEWCCWGNNWWQSSDWSLVALSLDAFKNSPQVAVRFLARNPLRVEDGSAANLLMDFQVDDVQIAETPPPPNQIALTAGPSRDPKHGATLAWDASTAWNFASYELYRSTTPGVSATDDLVTTISNQTTVSFEDTTLPVCGQTYYYRLIIRYADGAQTSTSEASYRTRWAQMVAALPFTEQFERGSGFWALDQPWAITAETSHGGTHALTDSPASEYANGTDRSATLKVDLRQASRPLLSFWHSYSLQKNQDYGFVEMSADDGATWTTWAAITGYGGWENESLDLTPYAGTQVLIRFRLKADAQTPDDGWSLDDVVIQENAAMADYPFYDSMDGAASRQNWIASTWTQVGGSAQDQPGQSWRCRVGDASHTGSNYYGQTLDCSLTLAGTLDLSHASAPQWWFWWRAGQQWYHTLAAQVSPDGGKNWETVWVWNTLDAGPSQWYGAQTDLTPYTGLARVGLRFIADNPPGTPLLLDFQIDQVMVGERSCPTILTATPLPDGIAGVSYSQTLQATNGTTPYTWSIVSNTLPPGLVLEGASGTLQGRPTFPGTFVFWVRGADATQCASQKEITLTILEVPPPLATQASQPFVSPGTNVVFCQVDNQSVLPLWSLVWSPSLPAGWSILSVSGDGQPELGLDGKIVFQSPDLGSGPLNFQYVLKIPAGQSQGTVVGGSVTYLFEGMGNDGTAAASPELLALAPRQYHSADCSQDWVLQTPEINRLLGYWRAGAYRLDPFTCDGYAAGQGDRVGPLHSADFEPPYWQIDGTELSRALAYWRAGCYHPDTNGVDGYAAGCATAGSLALVTQQAPVVYLPGASVSITNTIEYAGSLLSLLWRPHLPSGWTLQSVVGPGNPEMANGEILWIEGSLPPSPITMVYTVLVPASEVAPKQISGELNYYAQNMVNAATAYAEPNPVNLNAPQPIHFLNLTRLPDGSVRLDFEGITDQPIRLQFSPDLSAPTWTEVTVLPNLIGTAHYTDTSATNAPQRFYRTVSP